MKIKRDGQIYRVMFNEEFKALSKGTHQPMLWEDDRIVRLIIQEYPYKGVFSVYPFTGIFEEIYG